MPAFRCLYRVLLTALLLSATATWPACAQQRVGAASAVNPDAAGTPPGGAVRRLVIGQEVVYNEHITTTATGQTQILFVDESSMTIGPNSDLTIDKFVYDPNTGTGQLAMTATRGVLRFVGGKLSKRDNAVTVNTSAATIGIRGGVFLMNTDPTGKLGVVFVYGKGLSVTGVAGCQQSIWRPDFAIDVPGRGACPSAPYPAPPGTVANLLAALDGRPGGNGGARTVPTDPQVANSGIATTISGNMQASLQQAAQTRLVSPAPTVNVAALQTNLNVNTSTSQSQPFVRTVDANPPTPGTPVANRVQQPTAAVTSVAASTATTPVSVVTTSTGTTTTIPTTTTTIPTTTTTATTTTATTTTTTTTTGTTTTTTTTTTTPPPPPITLAGGFASTEGNGSTLGFTSLPLPAPYANGSLSNGTFSVAGSFGLVSFPLSVGLNTLDPSGSGTLSPLGPVTGTTYLSADNTFFYADLVPVTSKYANDSEFIYGGQAVGTQFYQATSTSPSFLAFNVQPDAALQSGIPFIRQVTGGSLAGSGTSISPLLLATPANSTFSTSTAGTKALQASLAVNGSGAQQSSVLVVLVGNVFSASLNGTSTNQPVLNGIIHGSYLPTASSQPTRIYAPYVTPADANGISFYGTNSAISGFVLGNGNCCTSSGELASTAFETNTANQNVTNYQFLQPALPTALPTSLTGVQSSQTLNGWFGGIMNQEPQSSSKTAAAAATAIAYPLAGTTTITTDAKNLQLAATLNGNDPLTASTSGINSAVLQFGSLQVGGTNARQAYIDNNLFAALESPVSATTVNNVTVPVNDSNTGANIYLLSQATAPAAGLLPNGLCDCQFLQWGYWGGELDTPASGNTAARTDVGHINFWVAGPQASISTAADLSTLASQSAVGSYTGNMIGSVFNAGSQYLASGGMKATYNFGTQVGSFSIVNYDGINLTAPIPSGSLNGSNYRFTFGGQGTSGVVNGTFFGTGANAATETGGNFAFSVGTNYLTSGIFGAKGTINRLSN